MEDPMNYYSDNSDDYDDNDASFLEEDENDDSSIKPMKPQNHKTLNQQDIRQIMEEEISNISKLLSLSKPEASLLLRYFNWSVTKLGDLWFVNESAIREKVGLLIKQEIKAHDEDDGLAINCGICFEYFSANEITCAGCGHPYCKQCWTGYISTSINDDGLAALSLRCPEPSCRVAVCKDMIDSIASKEDRDKYSQWWVKSYIEESKSRKWCPGANCDRAIEFISGDEASFDVTCSNCFTSFCWNCVEEGHRPLDCETVKKWILKNSSESENVTYIIACCKPCPRCKRPIEKISGCMHMTCGVCRHEFCWTCLTEFNHIHGCNGYTSNSSEKRKMAKKSLEKYAHYFERWDANRKSKIKAVADFQKLKNTQYKELSNNLGMSDFYFDFITKAWQQVIECRRVLEWSYAYGFYLPDGEKVKKRFFEYLQGEAESGLEKLHNLVEEEVKQFMNNNNASKDFIEYRKNVVQLTTVTGNYFEKLVNALENGLPEVGDPCRSIEDEC